MLRLTTRNFFSFLHNDLSNRLPPTFAEDCKITRPMGIRYLLIDPFCITRSGDYQRDWTREAAPTGAVYEHSYLNTASADSGNSDKECLFERVVRNKVWMNNKLQHHPERNDKPFRFFRANGPYWISTPKARCGKHACERTGLDLLIAYVGPTNSPFQHSDCLGM